MNISGKTKLVGILGHPVEHSLSPAMHNAAFRKLDIDFCYLPLHIFPQDLKRSVDLLRVIRNFRGANVTVPHKEAVLPLLDGVTREATVIGAVNTIEVREDRTLWGHNTDARGFLIAFREEVRVSLRGKIIMMFGAGGAARGVAYRLAKESVSEMTIVNRTLSRAMALAQQVRAWSPQIQCRGVSFDDPDLPWQLERVDVLIQATSLGLRPSDPLPFSLDGLQREAVVCDLVYRPGGTEFSNLAKRQNFKTMDGFPMLIHQGALAFEIWTGQSAPIQVMKDAFG